MALTDKLTAIGDAIREKTGSTDKLSLDEMATSITGIETGGELSDYIPDDAFILSGNCAYKFHGNTWNWFLENYGDKITTENITDANYMFSSNTDVTEIPFDINLIDGTAVIIGYIFYQCNNLNTVPYIKGRVSNACQYLFSSCYRLKTIPEDWADYIDWTYAHSNTYTNMSSVFYCCYSLRKIPDSLISNLWNVSTNTSYSPYYYTVYSCYVLDEIKNLPVQTSTHTSNMFSSTFYYCSRLKSMTFATQEDGSPYTANWKTQTIDLSSYVGYVYRATNITNYSDVHGLITATQVTDADTYEALKDNDDYWTTDVAYSRYNHDSAVETINSLPDTSTYLEENGGTNTIKFNGAAGSSTDGGAINTMTEEEIAVATAKGWTVSLV